MILTTHRLRLEPLDDSHSDGLLALNSDPEVMRFLGRPQTGEELLAWISVVPGAVGADRVLLVDPDRARD